MEFFLSIVFLDTFSKTFKEHNLNELKYKLINDFPMKGVLKLDLLFN